MVATVSAIAPGPYNNTSYIQNHRGSVEKPDTIYHLGEHQHPFQCGFTAATSPMNGALLVAEYLRECKDQKKTVYVAYLDVKSAFDEVSHLSLLRKLYNTGIESQCWSLIYQMHQGAKSSVKQCDAVSWMFNVEQRVYQGWILSTTLFKVYITTHYSAKSVTQALGRQLVTSDVVLQLWPPTWHSWATWRQSYR